ncbi:MAG: hypothetical protein WCO69_00040 [Candidatus Omnitrophota bacterium]
MRPSTRGQSLMEYVILLIVIIAALLTMQMYIKRGVQGHWKESVDGIGEQYDLDKTNSVITHGMQSNSESRLQVIKASKDGAAGYYTARSDSSSSKETKNGVTQIGHY